ncbi:inactive ribonuclease-like protein 9 [Molossus nigricans]
MRSLLTTQNLPLLLLLLQPRPPPVLMQYEDTAEERQEEFEDLWSELYSTGPTKPPTRKSFESEVIVDNYEPLEDLNYCDFGIMMKNVHTRLKCRKEHFFVQTEYEDLQKACSTRFVACKNGVKRCHKSKTITKAVYCNYTQGTRMPDCRYTSFYMRGYPIITCQWQDDIESLVPEYINNILEVPDK